MKTTKTMLKVSLLAAVMTACGGEVERPSAAAGPAGVELEIADEAQGDLDAQALDDYARLARQVAKMSQTLGLAGDPERQIRITYLGRGRIEASEGAPPETAAIRDPPPRGPRSKWRATRCGTP